MNDTIIADNSDLSRLEADLGASAANAGRNIRAAVEFTSRRIKDDWANLAKGFPHLPAFPYSITYDITVFNGFDASIIQSEIGPDKDRPQGALGNLVEYGSVNNPPLGLGHAALQNNETDFVEGLTKALDVFSPSVFGIASGLLRR